MWPDASCRHKSSSRRQVPAILYVVYPPEVKKTPEAPANARKELEKLGGPTRRSALDTLALNAQLAAKAP